VTNVSSVAPARPAGVPDSEARLVLEGISKRWPGQKAWTIRDVNLRVPAGGAIRISGANGTGKTTLLRVAAGILEPETGTVTVAGLTPSKDRREYMRRMGFLSATASGVYNRLTVRQHLRYWARIAFVPRSARDFAIEEALSRYGLSALAGRRLDRLSMGQRQRVRLAMTFLHAPDLVLLDEPRNSLDSEGYELLADVVAELCARGGAVVWCSPSGEDVGVDITDEYVIESGILRAS
jgi:ABC-type multidrug transport system ATPase subunit